jgi:hypothetical protein
MATHTVVALFDDYQEAESAIRDFKTAGIPSTDISLIANNSGNKYGDYPQYGADRTDRTDTADTGAATGTGAGIGAVLGGAAGLLAGIGALAIPGVGPVVAAGALAATLAGAGVGAVVGGLVGALVEAGIPREHADIYAEAVRRGGTLVTARADDVMRDRVSDILNRHAPVDVEERAESWRHTGWKGFDEQAEAYTDPVYPEAAASTTAGLGEPGTGVREPLRTAVAPGTSALGGRAETRPEWQPTPSTGAAADRPAEILPESGVSAPRPMGGASDTQRDWEVRRDEDRIREDGGRRTPVRVHPRVEESVSDKR